MVQANELRIGNYISYKNERWIKVGYHEIRYAVLYPDNSYYPIPLTPEILEKAGWYWNAECNSYEHADIRMNMQFREVNQSWTMYNHVLKAVIAKRIYHVHQLQNLYFALTGEELEINLT